MVYYDVKTLSELIKEYYELHKGPAYMDEIKLIKAWPKVVGPFIASHTIDLSIKNGVLFVRVDSDALRNELVYSKSILIKKLNGIVGREKLTELVLS